MNKYMTLQDIKILQGYFAPKMAGRRYMIYKIGSVKQVEKLKKIIPEEVYKIILDIVVVLDREYGSKRNIDLNDGGYIIFFDGDNAIEEIKKIICTDINMAEWIEPVGTEYLNAFCLKNNEFGINYILPKKLIPIQILNEWNL